MSIDPFLTPSDKQRAYLAERLGPRALSDIEEGTIVVIPSLSFPPEELRKILAIQHYEERLLFMTLLLDRPGIEMVYVTSTPIPPSVIEYYMLFLQDPIGAVDCNSNIKIEIFELLFQFGVHSKISFFEWVL